MGAEASGLDVDTIAAISTARGVGAIALVRVSGPGSAGVLRKLATGLDGLPEPRRATVVELRDPDDGSTVDRAVVTWLMGPASYTGEDMVELACHGGWLGPEIVLDACLRAGARLAEAGELTRRAYLRGKLDLLQAEATADLIEARSRAFHAAALHQVERGLSARVCGVRERLVHLEALIAHHIDFPEEDDAPVPIERVLEAAGVLVQEIDALLATAPEGEQLREGALAVLAGRPNAGKSSLYNALLGEERAIVTEEPGTTRDALEATVQVGGYPFRLVDTAGLRESEQTVERLGIEVARRYVERADLVLLCVPSGEGVGAVERAFVEGLDDTPVVMVETKADLGGPRAEGQQLGAAARVRLSVRTGEGLEELRAVLPRVAYGRLLEVGASAPVITRRRHARGLERARAEVVAFGDALRDGLPAEVASTHLRSAETAVEELLGVVSVEDVLEVVFREFCVGK